MKKQRDLDSLWLTASVYREDFENGELAGWASYPPCQDTAYNPYVYPGRIAPGDTNTCFVAMEEVHWHEDQLLGGVKLLDMVLDRDFTLSFRYYIKTLSPAASLTIHLPLESGERLIYTLDKPPVNRWFGVSIGWRELEKQNLAILERNRVRITALAIEVRITKADPDMNVYFGIDDVELTAQKELRFTFETPAVAVLDEWAEAISLRHNRLGEKFRVSGRYDFTPDSVSLELTSFTSRETVLVSENLEAGSEGLWSSTEHSLDSTFPPGLYRGTVTALEKGNAVSETPFTFFVADNSIGGRHPRLFYDETMLPSIRERFMSDRFKDVRAVFEKEAREHREKAALETVRYDFDQFPTKDWIASLWHWFIHRVMLYREALYTNAVMFSMTGDKEAGDYTRGLLLVLAEFPAWNHPWKEARGLHAYFPMAEMTEAYALAYDLVYDLLSVEDRQTVQEAMISNYVKPAFRTYVEHNRISSNSSNWLSHLMGASAHVGGRNVLR